jgi:twitching motility protein PilT
MHLVDLIQAARAKMASDLHLIAGLPPALRINGEIVISVGESLSRETLSAMALETLSAEQKQHLEGNRELCYSLFDRDGRRTRVTVYYHAGSPEMAVRLCFTEIPSATELGLPPVIDELARRPNGLVLVSGPTGSGKTTTLNYMVDLINRERRCKIVTIEDPIEFVHRPQKSIVVQQEVHTDTLSFSRAIIHVLRQNPDVIVIGEMRELETIMTALTAAETGHLVLATLHTPNTLQTVERITAVFPAGQQKQVLIQLANSLQGVITQDLIPRVDRKGRVMAYEVLLATNAVRNNIRENNIHMLYSVLETGRKEGMITMDTCLLNLYQKALITYDAAVSRARNVEQLTRAAASR